MKASLLFLSLQILTLSAFAQSLKADDPQAKFPGGQSALNRYLGQKLDSVVKEAAAKGLNGVVHIFFFIEKDGSIEQVNVMRGLDSIIDSKVVQCIRSMPLWEPAIQGGQPIRSSYRMPLKFGSGDNKIDSLNPSFMGGEEALNKYLSSHLKRAFRIAQKKGIKGRLWVSFVIDRTGSVADVQIVNSFDSELDREVKKVFEDMPEWKPGIKDGEAMTLPKRLFIEF